MNYVDKFPRQPDTEDDDDVYLRPGDAFVLMGKRFVVESGSSNPRGYIAYDPDAPGDGKKFANADIKRWWREEKLVFVSRDEFGLPIGVQESLRRTLRAFRPDERKEMMRRLRYCKALDALGPGFSWSKETLQPVCDKIAEDRNDTGSHSWTTVKEWWERWVKAGRDARALNPSFRRRGNRTDRLPEYMRIGIERGVRDWLRLDKPKKTTSYKVVVGHCIDHHGGRKAVEEILEQDTDAWLWPSYRTFATACNKLSRAERRPKRHGFQVARQELYPVMTGPEPTFPLQRVESDFKYLRVLVVDDGTGLPLGTPYLMAAIDGYSGVITGYDLGFDPPSYTSAARCLKHMVSPKGDYLEKLPRDEHGDPQIRHSYPVNGVPFQFFLDNDAAFHARSFEVSAHSLGCHIDYVPPGEPWKKGKIERFWGSLQTAYLDMFPGRILRIGNGAHEYDPTKDAVLTLSALNLVITKAIVDVHHEAEEPGTGKKRIDLWREGVDIHPPRPVRDHESLVELVGGYKERTAERRGIAMFGLRYNSSELAAYRSGFDKDPRVAVRYDPDDISHVWVVDPDQGLTLKVRCTRMDYAEGLSEHQHNVIKRHAGGTDPEGRRLRMKQLLLAKVELYELGLKLIGNKRRSSTKAAVARFLGIGREIADEAQKPIVDPTENDSLELAVEDAEDDARAREDEAMVDELVSNRRKGSGTSIGDDSEDEVEVAMSPETPSQDEPGTPPIEADTSPLPEPPKPRRRRDREMKVTHD